MKSIIYASLLLSSAMSVKAADSIEQQGEWKYTGQVAVVSIDSKTAANEGIDDAAWVVGFSADYHRNAWVSSLGVDILIYDDNHSFKQQVEGSGVFNSGDQSTESSEATGFNIFVASGYQWTFGEKGDVAATLQGGFSFLTASERAIGNCSNCYSEDIELDSGLFVRASVAKSTENFSFGLYLQQFLAGDGLSNSLGVTIASPF